MLSGYLFAILTGIFYGLQGTYGKVLTRNIPIPILTWGSFFFTLPYLGILLIFQGIPEVQWKDFLWATGVSFLVNVVAWNLYFRALRSAPLAHTMPFTAFTPLFLIPVSFILIGELPSWRGVAGILLIISGGYGIHLKSSNLLEPLRSLIRNTGTRLMLIVAFIWSISATVEKVAVLASSQSFYAFTIFSLLSLAYLPYLLWKPEEKLTIVQQNLLPLFLFGLISGAMIWFQFTALKYLLVSYVIAFKRAGVVVSVFLGIWLFKEKGAFQNLLCTFLMVAGVFLIMS
jgi:drug/metabolite transporter (DMT)-like permease